MCINEYFFGEKGCDFYEVFSRFGFIGGLVGYFLGLFCSWLCFGAFFWLGVMLGDGFG